MDNKQMERAKNRLENEETTGNLIKDYGQITLCNNSFHHKIHLLNIIGEIEGHEYHFVDEERMGELEAAGLIVEHRQYDTVHGIWHYFTVDDNELVRQTDVRYAMIGTLEAYVSLKEYYGDGLVVPIYIKVDDFERLRRAVNREKRQANPNCEEVCRRYLADERDFSEDKLASAGIDRCYVNNSIKECVADIVNDIKSIR